MNKKAQALNSIVKGGLLLTVSSFISKFLSAIYKIPFQNLTGDEGFYVYQQVYPLYGLAVALTMTGFPIFVSKIVSETKEDSSLKHRLQEVNSWLILLGLVFFLVLQFGASRIAQWMGDPQLDQVIRSVSYFYLFSPFLAMSRGYFQGFGNMMPTSLSQVIEQLVRVSLLLWVAFNFGQRDWSYYEMGRYAYHSAWISAGVACVVLYLFFKRTDTSIPLHAIFRPKFSLKMGKRMVTEGFLFIIVGSLTILFQVIDSFTVYNGLIDSGYSMLAAMSLKGVYDRGQPLVQLGMVVGISLSMSSLPLLRNHAVESKWSLWVKEASTMVKLTILLSSAATIGLIAVMPWMNLTLFKDQHGTQTLQVMVVSVFLMSLIYCLHTLVQSREAKDYTIIYLAFGLIFKATLNKIAVHHLGIMGSSIMTVLSLLLILICMLVQMNKEVVKTVYKDHFGLQVGLIVLNVYGSVTGVLSLIQHVVSLEGRLFNLILTLIGVIVGVVVFALLLKRLNILNADEVEQFPLLNKLEKKRK